MSETRERLTERLSEIAEWLRGGVLEQRPLREPMTEEAENV